MKIYLAMITVCTLFLSGCSRNNANTSNIDQTDLQKQQIVIKQNKKKWHQQTNQVAQSTLSAQEMPLQKNLSLARLKKNSDFIVQGTVINFSHSHKESTETSIYINHVISGSEDILGKNIEVKLPGGIEENIYYKRTFSKRNHSTIKSSNPLSLYGSLLKAKTALKSNQDSFFNFEIQSCTNQIGVIVIICRDDFGN